MACMAAQVNEKFEAKFGARLRNYLKCRRYLMYHRYYLLLDKLSQTLDWIISSNQQMYVDSVESSQIITLIAGSVLNVRAALLTPNGAITNYTCSVDDLASAEMVLVCFGGHSYTLERPRVAIPESEFSIFEAEEARHLSQTCYGPSFPRSARVLDVGGYGE